LLGNAEIKRVPRGSGLVWIFMPHGGWWIYRRANNVISVSQQHFRSYVVSTSLLGLFIAEHL
jgi:hypothetical protein